MSLYSVGILKGSNGRTVFSILQKYIDENQELQNFFDPSYPVIQTEASSGEEARQIYREQNKASGNV